MAIVASAMGGKPKVTDLLLNSVSIAAAGNRAGSEVLTDCSTRRSDQIDHGLDHLDPILTL